MSASDQDSSRGIISKVAGSPDFRNLLAVLEGSRPGRPTLFEFFLNERLLWRFTGEEVDPEDWLPYSRMKARAFCDAGYDYATVLLPGFRFSTVDPPRKASKSLNAAASVTDRASFNSHPWPDPRNVSYELIDEVAAVLPRGAGLIAYSVGGVLEIVTLLVGFDNLCYLLADDPPLVSDICEAVGSRLLGYYENCLANRHVGAIIVNDDWGFKTQTMLPPETMRRLVFPWHRQIVAAAHKAGKPAILHSCGKLESVMDDVIEVMKFDAKHSWEDSILPVEKALEIYGSRIAVLGGVDVDFLCRATPEEIYRRSRNILDGPGRGSYALGSGNSVPEYVPDENYFAMVRAALEGRGESVG